MGWKYWLKKKEWFSLYLSYWKQSRMSKQMIEKMGHSIPDKIILQVHQWKTYWEVPELKKIKLNYINL